MMAALGFLGTFLFKQFLVPLAASFLPKLINAAQIWIDKILMKLTKSQAAEEYKDVMDAIEQGDTKRANEIIKNPNAHKPSGRDGMQTGSRESDGVFVPGESSSKD